MKKRIEKVRQLMEKEDLDALLIDSSVNRFYLTGFTGTSGRVLFTPCENYFITDFRYREQAEAETSGYVVEEISRKIIENIGELLHKEDVKVLGFEAKTVTQHQLQQYRDKWEGIELVPTTDLVAGLRLYKDEGEIKRIEKAIEIAEEAFEHIIEFIEPGKTEREISLELEYYMKKQGGERNSFDFIVASGKRSSLPHGVASEKKLDVGDFITMDYGTVYKGYCSDITRTVVLGSADEEQKQIYDTVLAAQRRVIEEIKPGMKASSADALARDIITEAGYGDNFGHSLGHGLGIEVHESPRLSRDNDQVLKPGMVVTDEPGIYIPDWGGVRIEDDLLLTEDGCRVLSGVTKDLIELN